MTKRSPKSIATLILLALAGSLLLGTGAQAGGRARRALTLWWVIFNEPKECVTNPGAAVRCGEIDVFGADYVASVEAGAPDPSLLAPNTAAGLAVLYATGGVTGRTGKVQLAASIYRSHEALDLGGDQVVDPMGLGKGFTDPGAEVHLVVRDHGPRVREGELAQITNFLEPYCSDPALGFEAGPNTCADIQFATFPPAASGDRAVYSFEHGEAIRGANATLIRQGDVLQAVVETRVKGHKARK